MDRSRKMAAAAMTAGGLLLGTGIAAALELPDQPDTSVAEERAGDVEAPPADAQAKAAEHRQNEADDETAEAATTAEAETSDVESEGDGEGGRPTDTHGYQVSQLATTTEAEGRDKGEEISTLAKTNGEQQPSADEQDADEQGGRSAEARAARGR